MNFTGTLVPGAYRLHVGLDASAFATGAVRPPAYDHNLQFSLRVIPTPAPVALAAAFSLWSLRRRRAVGELA